jgi:hypothetical protein
MLKFAFKEHHYEGMDSEHLGDDGRMTMLV